MMKHSLEKTISSRPKGDDLLSAARLSQAREIRGFAYTSRLVFTFIGKRSNDKTLWINFFALKKY
jgi:hypothetical protein